MVSGPRRPVPALGRPPQRSGSARNRGASEPSRERCDQTHRLERPEVSAPARRVVDRSRPPIQLILRPAKQSWPSCGFWRFAPPASRRQSTICCVAVVRSLPHNTEAVSFLKRSAAWPRSLGPRSATVAGIVSGRTVTSGRRICQGSVVTPTAACPDATVAGTSALVVSEPQSIGRPLFLRGRSHLRAGHKASRARARLTSRPSQGPTRPDEAQEAIDRNCHAAATKRHWSRRPRRRTHSASATRRI